jgi:hypothetical protein
VAGTCLVDHDLSAREGGRQIPDATGVVEMDVRDDDGCQVVGTDTEGGE